MKNKQYYELAKRYEREARENPLKFERRLNRLMWLGYGYIGVIFTVLVLLATASCIGCWLAPNIAFFGIAGITLFAIYSLLKNLLQKIPGAPGIKLNRDKFPELFAEIDRLREQMDVAEIDNVKLERDLNAHAGEFRPRPLMGQFQRFLGLGLPLMEALNVDEFRSVLAHELAHLARGHSRIHSKVFRLRSVWMNILAAGTDTLFWWRWFASYYGDHFETMTSVISREYEFEADRIAAAAIGNEEVVSGHLLGEVLNYTAQREHDDWINDQLVTRTEAVENAISEFNERLKKPLKKDECEKYLRRILSQETVTFSSHPSCRERVIRCGFPGDLPLAEQIEHAWSLIATEKGERASDYFLKSSKQELLKVVDAAWKVDHDWDWNHQHEYLNQCQKQFDELEAKIKSASTPHLIDIENRAFLILILQGKKEANEAFETILETHPDSVDANRITGIYAYNIEFDLKKAQQRLLRCLELDPRCETEISAYMWNLCLEMEQAEDAERWKEYNFGAADALEESNVERSSVKPKDKFLPPRLSESELEELVAQFRDDERIGKVWLAIKKVEYYSEKPFYIIGIEPNESIFTYSSVEKYNLILNDILKSLVFEHQYFLILLRGEYKRYRKKFKKLGKETTLIFNR